jgi:UDP-N-acetylmuramate dehydrogenase
VSTAERQRVDDAARILGPQAERDVPLGPMTTYRVGGSAALFARPASLDDLAAITRACDATGLPILVVGRGSNLLVADVGFVGIAVSLSLLGTGIEIGSGPTDDESAGPVLVRAGGAVALPVLARRTVAASLTGFEWAVGVPGTVGGGVRMNAGGHGSDMAATLIDVELFDLRRGESVTLPAAALAAPGARGVPASLSGARVYVTTWDYDGGYRALQRDSAPFAVGGGDPARDVRVMDDSVVIRLP